MAIQKVRVQINGVWHILTYNTTTGTWNGTVTAPPKTSYNMPGGYYPLAVDATNTAGTVATADVTDVSVGDSLKLVVREKVAPVITVQSPTSGAYVSNNQQPILFTVTDEPGGSGVDKSKITVKLNSTILTGLDSIPISNGYSCKIVPPVMADGKQNVYINASDFDGNAAAQKTISFTVDTIPPTLNIISPVDGLETATKTLTIAGITNDTTSSPVTIKISVNGVYTDAVTVGADGTFNKIVTLTEGENAIIITATDAAQKSTVVHRNVTLDTTVPQISSVTIAPNPADAGASVIVSVVVK